MELGMKDGTYALRVAGWAESYYWSPVLLERRKRKVESIRLILIRHINIVFSFFLFIVCKVRRNSSGGSRSSANFHFTDSASESRILMSAPGHKNNCPPFIKVSATTRRSPRTMARPIILTNSKEGEFGGAGRLAVRPP
jgi:hypothetical protein